LSPVFLFDSPARSWQFGAPGDKFDPHHHDALFEYPDPTKEAGTIGQVRAIGMLVVVVVMVMIDYYDEEEEEDEKDGGGGGGGGGMVGCGPLRGTWLS
jgi:hypothetical protein